VDEAEKCIGEIVVASDDTARILETIEACLSGLLPIVATSIFAVRWIVKMSLHST
jgi:hypothetical protein